MDNLQTQRIFTMPPRAKVAGASLFVFSIDPIWGNIYFWLGKERKNLRWPQGSETWSDFGGRPTDDQEDPPHIAAREFLEETCAMLRYFEHDTIPRQGMEDIAESLRQHKYLFCVTMWTENAHGEKRMFVTYVKQVPWSPDAHNSFQEAHQYLHKLRSQAAAHTMRGAREVLSVFPHPSIQRAAEGAAESFLDNSIHINTDYLEKKSIRMWSIPQLRTAIELQLLREEREKERKSKALGFLGAPVAGIVPENDHMVKSLVMRSDRFRSCFISMATVILKELPFYEPLTNENNKLCRV